MLLSSHARLVFGWTVVVLAVTLAACSGPPQTTSGDTDGPAAPGDTPDRVPMAEVETFDATIYPVRPPERTVEVSHAVPRRLMQGRADEGVTQTIEGFRIQVYSAQDKMPAEEFREEVRQWWQSAQNDAPADVFSQQPPIVIEYAQPYYRVRFGAFASRDNASRALEFVRNEYPDAFMARSTVTVTRE